MKWILILCLSLLPATLLSATLECQQTTALLKEVRNAQRAGYSIKQGHYLNCVKRYAQQALKQACKTTTARNHSRKPISVRAKNYCKKQK